MTLLDQLVFVEVKGKDEINTELYCILPVAHPAAVL